MTRSMSKWQILIDRGGTFTDFVAKNPAGEIITTKLLSENPHVYKNSAIAGIRKIMGIKGEAPIPSNMIEFIKIGTTVATNALLEQKGAKCALIITKGLKDCLEIAYQNRPNIFEFNIKLPKPLYSEVIEIDERMNVQGQILKKIDIDNCLKDLRELKKSGIKNVAIVLMNSYKNTQHEKQVEKICKDLGFEQISVSHKMNKKIKIIARGDTCVVDAYLSPVLNQYMDQILYELGDVNLFFMQSNGGLAEKMSFCGKDAILSGPAGGIVGAVKTSENIGYKKVIGFDMGGTSTDVSHYKGEYERKYESEIAGIRIQAPMMNIHTVAAGGGSICFFDQGRFQVGPESAGANPGPASYRKGGPLTITDCNFLLGKIQSDFFPNVFGENQNESLDLERVTDLFEGLREKVFLSTKVKYTVANIAEGFLTIAVENMANAIKKISTQRGYDVKDYVLNCFGGAGAQHACLVAENLGIKKILIHKYAGVLSAFGIGLADITRIKESTIEEVMTAGIFSLLDKEYKILENDIVKELSLSINDEIFLHSKKKIFLKYEGTDTCIELDYKSLESMRKAFIDSFFSTFGYRMQGQKNIIISSISVEIILESKKLESYSKPIPVGEVVQNKFDSRRIYLKGMFFDCPVFYLKDLEIKKIIKGPALIIENNSTIVCEPGWSFLRYDHDNLVLNQDVIVKDEEKLGGKEIKNKSKFGLSKKDPIRLEIFNNIFMSIAEQMGIVLAKTAYSVNIKERLDFSCAIFNSNGDLVANAPHVPVHLGSMGQSVKAILSEFLDDLKKGKVYLTNSPYNGGTHLPDLTVISPYVEHGEIQFIFASRAHHADIGGIVPGSIPPFSTSIEDEGVLIHGLKIVENNKLLEGAINDLFLSIKPSARNIPQNFGDLQAQIAANTIGVKSLQSVCAEYGLETVKTYMDYIQENAEEEVRKTISGLKDGSYSYYMDDQTLIQVKMTFDKAKREALIDFSGTSKQKNNNFNTPRSVCMAAVLYVFRSLIKSNMPLNEGCLKPLKILIPKGSILDPEYPAAVVAGNVETSQCIVDSLLGALGALAGSQGTMNNFIFGNDDFQYYETIGGGSGAGEGFDGASAVQSHMTNSRITDPEILEFRFPVLLNEFSICRNSGGRGKWNGGDGVVREVEFLEAMQAAIVSGHRKILPFGLNGGEGGKVGKNSLIKKSGVIEGLDAVDHINMEIGDRIRIQTPGGGGFGKSE